MMMKLVIAVCILGTCVAAPQQPQKDPVPIILQESSVGSAGTFQYKYETGDGIKAEQAGELKSISPNEEGESVHGSFSYTGDDGAAYSLTYTADENGFVPQGAHIHPIPAAIQRSLEYNAAHPEQDKS